MVYMKLFMLVNVYKLLAKELNCELLGIAHKNQRKISLERQCVCYLIMMIFGKENNALLNAQGYWQYL